jgi:hypothetical protein
MFCRRRNGEVSIFNYINHPIRRRTRHIVERLQATPRVAGTSLNPNRNLPRAVVEVRVPRRPSAVEGERELLVMLVFLAPHPKSLEHFCKRAQKLQKLAPYYPHVTIMLHLYSITIEQNYM